MLESAPKHNPIINDIEITQMADCQTKLNQTTFKYPATKETMKAFGSAVDKIILKRGQAGFRGIQIRHKNGNKSKMFEGNNIYKCEVETIKDLAQKRIARIGFKVHTNHGMQFY